LCTEPVTDKKEGIQTKEIVFDEDITPQFSESNDDTDG